MQGSANLTLASTTNQWNDIYTHTRSRKMWKFYDRVFDEAARDRRAKKPFAVLKNPQLAADDVPPDRQGRVRPGDGAAQQGQVHGGDQHRVPPDPVPDRAGRDPAGPRHEAGQEGPLAVEPGL